MPKTPVPCDDGAGLRILAKQAIKSSRRARRLRLANRLLTPVCLVVAFLVFKWLVHV